MLIETRRLVICDHTMANLDLMLAWENDPELLYYNDDQPEPYELTEREEMERYLERLVKNDGSRGMLYFAIHLKRDNRLIGYGMFAFVNPYHRRCKLGITIGEKTEWGKGYGSEALQGLLEYCFTEMNMHRVGAEVYAINPRSIRMMERAGFRREGVMRQAVLKDGRMVDEYVYGMLRSEWEDESSDSYDLPASAIGVIGGADGPTAIFVSSRPNGGIDPQVRIVETGGRRQLIVTHGDKTQLIDLGKQQVAGREVTGGERHPCHRTYDDWGGCRDLDKLLSLDFDLERLMGLRFDTTEREGRYDATPPIGVVIADTGVDGMHLCLVPRYGAASLDIADVWPISPMDIDQTRSAVPPQFTFRDMLRVFITVPDATFLFGLQSGMSREQFNDRVSYFQESLAEDEQREKLVEAIKQEFGIQPIADLYAFFFEDVVQGTEG